MTPDLTVSALDAIIAGCLAHKEHLLTILFDGCALCRICATTWPDAEAYVADTAACPGSRTCSALPVGPA